jgi:hypothetical protein
VDSELETVDKKLEQSRSESCTSDIPDWHLHDGIGRLCRYALLAAPLLCPAERSIELASQPAKHSGDQGRTTSILFLRTHPLDRLQKFQPIITITRSG